jgi:hypothetical protein
VILIKGSSGGPGEYVIIIQKGLISYLRGVCVQIRASVGDRGSPEKTNMEDADREYGARAPPGERGVRVGARKVKSNEAVLGTELW